VNERIGTNRGLGVESVSGILLRIKDSAIIVIWVRTLGWVGNSDSFAMVMVAFPNQVFIYNTVKRYNRYSCFDFYCKS